MKEKAKKIFYIIVGAMVLCMFVYFMLIAPIISLSNKKDLYTLNVDGAFEILELEHSIDGLIPIGKDYYYVGVSKGTQDAYLIRAPKSWLKKNFNADYASKDFEGFNLTAPSVGITDSKVRNELTSRISQIEGLNYPLGTDYCLEFSYKSIAIKKLLLFAYALILIIAGIYLSKNDNKVSNKVPVVFLCALLIFLILMLMTIK